MAQKDYTAMWEALGLDLEAHDGLLGVLGQAYADIFLSQRHRPESMGYLDFVLSEIHGLRIEELLKAKEEGRPVWDAVVEATVAIVLINPPFSFRSSHILTNSSSV